jgi:hypothetical protein
MSVPRTIQHLLILLALVLICLWPAILNGYPFIGSDTPAYVRYPDAAVAKLLGRTSAWAEGASSHPAAPADVASRPASGDTQYADKTPFLGRSIYYGAILELGNVLGVMWISIAVQAAVVLLTIALTLQATIGFGWRVYAGMVIGLSLITPLAFFASFLMPDVFAGVAIASAAALLVYGDKMTRVTLLAWAGLLAASLLSHSSHVLVASGLLAICLVARILFRTPISTWGMVSVGLCIVVAFAGDAAVTAASIKVFGVKPIRPPFLMARLIVDGPGEAYLRSHCPESGFTVCRFLDRLPSNDAEVFLWSPDPATGVFSASDGATRRALADEQFRFASAVVRYDPLGVAAAAVRNTLIQSGKLLVTFFNLNDVDRGGLRQEVPPRDLQALEATRSWNDTLPLMAMSVVIVFGLGVSCCYLAVALFSRTSPSRTDRSLRAFTLIVLFAILLNAFVCGAMSDPFARYQTRVIWLIPLLAGLFFLVGLPSRAAASNAFIQGPHNAPLRSAGL